MNDISGVYDVYYESTSVGKLTVWRDGAAYTFSCSCRQVSPEVLRLHCVSGGNSVPLGVMLPQGGELVLKRRLTKNALGDMGLNEISGCHLRGKEEPVRQKETAMAAAASEKPAAENPKPSSWLPAAEPSSLFSDPDLAAACRGVAGALKREDGDCLLLAIPVLPGAPFPLMPIFCFGYSENIGGVNFVVFRLRGGLLIP